MIPFNAYAIYRSERAVSEREQRLADARAGELAADFSRLRALLARPVHVLQDLGSARRGTSLTETGKRRVRGRWL
jgi:hypothetical protein